MRYIVSYVKKLGCSMVSSKQCVAFWAAHGLSTGDPSGSGRRGSTVAGGDSRWDDGYTKWFFLLVGGLEHEFYFSIYWE